LFIRDGADKNIAKRRVSKLRSLVDQGVRPKSVDLVSLFSLILFEEEGWALSETKAIQFAVVAGQGNCGESWIASVTKSVSVPA
jgi:hypothetical protein